MNASFVSPKNLNYNNDLSLNTENNVFKFNKENNVFKFPIYPSIETNLTLVIPIQSEITTTNLIQENVFLSHQENTLSHCEIQDLVDDYSFLYPIIIKLVELKDDGIFVSECSMLNLYAEGRTREEAIDDMKSLIVDDYLAFLKDYPDGLSDDAISIVKLYSVLLGKDLPS
jgi:predicted RNase H-like HicB family nuclease